MQIFQVDAFTNKPFSGNPAAVCIMDEKKPDRWLQNFAAEMNLSETAFVEKVSDGFNLRWFTPKNEEELCGHATLASAHVLWESGILEAQNEARFHTKSGLLTAKKSGEWIYINLPVEPPEKAEAPKSLIDGLGVNPVYTGKNRLDYIVEIESEERLRELNPDMEKLEQVNTRGIIVTSKTSSSKYDFISRFFAPGLGISEDPVTGSAHCCLAPYWAKSMRKYKFMAYQASPRGGELKVNLTDDRVVLGGETITVIEGKVVV